MAMTGRALNAKLFLEGLEVPLIGATVTFSVNSAAIAYIDVVPHKSINNIKPRTLVHLFVRDYHNPESGFPYILMFEGEVFGFSFGKTTTSRTMSLSCIDYSSYWDNALAYFMNPLQSLGKGAEGLSSMGKEMADNSKQKIPNIPVTHSISSYFLQLVERAMKDGGDLLDGLVNIYKNITRINEFYKYAEQRLHIIDRIALKSSNKLKELLAQQQARDWFEGIVGRNSGLQTLRMVIQDFMSIIFHDGVTVPFPATVNKKLVEFIFKPNMYMLPPPICNIFYPDEYSSFSYSRNFFQEPTRLIYQPTLPLFGDATGIQLPHTYAPESFAHFMRANGNKAMSSSLVGSGDLQVSKDRFGFYEDPDNSESKETNNGKKKESQFLTNEERMKGILLNQESMMPAVTQFRGSLGDAGNRTTAYRIANYLFFKKRFQGREVQITSHLKPSVVPGFNVLVLDDSDADQSVIAYCSSVTHRIYANQGGYTNVQLNYARSVEEQEVSTGSANQPLIPPWFDDAVFGSVKNGELQVTQKLSEFYAALLGASASKSINGYTNKNTLKAAVDAVKAEYINAKSKGLESVNNFIRKTTHRDYVSLKKTFSYIGGTTKTKDENLPYMEFIGIKTTDMDLKKKEVVKKYRDTLKQSRGFRG